MSQTPAPHHHDMEPLPPSGQPVPRVTPPTEDKDRDWLVRKSTIKMMWIGGAAILVVLALLDFFVHGHPYFGIDGTFGFWSWYGFLTCIAMVVFAKGLGIFLKRKDTYYDDE